MFLWPSSILFFFSSIPAGHRSSAVTSSQPAPQSSRWYHQPFQLRIAYTSEKSTETALLYCVGTSISATVIHSYILL